jgi:hypothetical protein
VQHNATRPLRAGQSLTVTVRGTPGLRGTFTVLPDVPETTMTEDRSRPGFYTGTYVVQPGDNVLNGRVSAYLRNTNGREAFLQSQSSVTLDTVAPRITGTSPASSATVSTSQPNIVINATDVGGSGLDSASVSINGQQVDVNDITVSSNSISVIPADVLNGQVTVNATISDRAGNQARRSFTFFVDDSGRGGSTTITSVTTNATRDTQTGERVTVDLRAPADGTASFDVLSQDRRVLIRNVRMTEIATGRYRGSFTVPSGSESRLYVLGRYTDVNGRTSTEEAASPISVVGGANNNLDQLTITTPREGDQVSNTITVRGTAEPGATVEVSVVAQGTRYLILPYSNNLGTQQVQANSSGSWTTGSINLPRPSNVSELRYTITAIQSDGANRSSDPVTVTVTPR